MFSCNTILLVEDDDVIAWTTELRLKQLPNVKVVVAKGRTEAEKILSEAHAKGKPFDIVISDSHLEEKFHGFGVLTLAKEMNRACRIVLLSALDFESESKTFSLGDLLVLQKPISLRDLSDAIGTELEKIKTNSAKCLEIDVGQVREDINELERTFAKMNGLQHLQSGMAGDKCYMAKQRLIEHSSTVQCRREKTILAKYILALDKLHKMKDRV